MVFDEVAFRAMLREELRQILQEREPIETLCKGSGLLTQSEAAEYAKVTTATIRNWQKQGMVSYRLGPRTVRYKPRDIDFFLAKGSAVDMIVGSAAWLRGEGS